MEAKDLMIGDWVQNPLGAKGWVKEIRLIPKDSDGFGGYYLVDIAYSKDGDSYARLEAKELNPIPLAPEILEKNGWVNEHLGAQWQEWWLDKTKFPIVRYSVNDTLHHNGIVLKFVHQLQQALKVCGIDKEIDLNNTEN